MRLVTFLTVIILLVGTDISIAQENQVDFSGEWILDADKSDLGGGPGGRRGGRVASKMVVIQDEEKLVVESFRKNRDGDEVSTVATYTLDGEDCENETFNRTSVSTAEWSDDEKSLIIFTEMTFSRGDQDFTMDSETTWSLEENELFLETERSTPRGEMTSKSIYKRADK